MSGDVRSLIATRSKPLRALRWRATRRPILPNPLIATLTLMHASVGVVVGG